MGIKQLVLSSEKLRRLGYFFIYVIQYRRMVKKHGFLNIQTLGEKDYKKKWGKLSKLVDPYSYRYFRNYFGDNPNIVPENIGHAIIEECLNPLKYRSVYMDKNLFPTFVGGDGVLPATLLCRIHGSNILDSNYQIASLPIEKYVSVAQSLILKPSVDSSSGRNVLKFNRADGGGYFTLDEIELTREFLLGYGEDFCLQEAVEQHSFMKRLCTSSINTIRLCVYRSVLTEKSIVTASIIRMGKEGAYIDNAHAGGVFVGVNTETGELGKYVCDQYGNKTNVWNDIDYQSENLIVPNWESIVQFAQKIGSSIHHHRILQLDVYLKQDGTPGLIEFNIKSIGYWLYFCTGQSPFGDYTDEIIDYCKHILNKK